LEVLELRPDGEYTQRFNGKQGVESTAAGRWEFEPYAGEGKVVMHNFSSHFPGASPDKVDAFLLGVDRNWGTIRLYFSFDRDQYYLKNSIKQ
jgi:hypothetical protein